MNKVKTNTKNEKILLLGFPGNGLIGIFAISYFISNLQMKLVGEINHPDLPSALFIENGEIISPIRVYEKNNFYVIISDIPIYPDIEYEFVNSIVAYCMAQKISKVILSSGIATNDVDQKNIKTYSLATDVSFEKILYETDTPKFLSGTIIGIDATIITAFRNAKIPLLVLYTSCHPFFPDPQASIHAIESLAKILKIKADTSDIQKRIDYLKIQHRNLMQETLDALQQQEKQLPNKIPPIYR